LGDDASMFRLAQRLHDPPEVAQYEDSWSWPVFSS
jgi:hypothetical protein